MWVVTLDSELQQAAGLPLDASDLSILVDLAIIFGDRFS